MADIVGTALFSQKENEFRARGGSMDRFRADYVNAVNDVIASINLLADLSTAVAAVSNTETDIGFDQLYRYPFSQLLSLRLFEQGQRPTSGGDLFYADLKRDRENYIDMFRQGITNASMTSDTDESGDDVVGLGALG